MTYARRRKRSRTKSTTCLISGADACWNMLKIYHPTHDYLCDIHVVDLNVEGDQKCWTRLTSWSLRYSRQRFFPRVDFGTSGWSCHETRRTTFYSPTTCTMRSWPSFWAWLMWRTQQHRCWGRQAKAKETRRLGCACESWGRDVQEEHRHRNVHRVRQVRRAIHLWGNRVGDAESDAEEDFTHEKAGEVLPWHLGVACALRTKVIEKNIRSIDMISTWSKKKYWLTNTNSDSVLRTGFILEQKPIYMNWRHFFVQESIFWWIIFFLTDSKFLQSRSCLHSSNLFDNEDRTHCRQYGPW